MTRFFARVSARVGQAYTKLFPNTLKKRTWWPVFFVGVFLVTAMSVGVAHAVVGFALEALLNGLVELIAGLLVELSKLCIFLTIFFLRAFITLASYNNFIDVSVVKLGWVMVRDVANMFFIVGLLVIAFATILGFESYEWKRGLIKIVLMAILINFSNLIAQLVIDIAHIFTITFLNAVSATAGGNLITMFQMDSILELTRDAPNQFGVQRQHASFTIFAGAVLAFIFALLAALTIGAYMVVMIARIVVLWALIVLSPLAFMLYAIPKGEKYATEWWNEFSKHVIVAPVMVFFLWLAFATLGTGQIITEITKGPGSENVIQLNSSSQEQSVSILEISTWENFASFLLGIGFLMVGLKKTQETGATGAGLVGGAIDFTKKVATVATGYAAGRWLVGAGVEGGKSAALGIGKRIPIIGGAAWVERAGKVKARYQENRTRSKITKSERAKELEEKGGVWNKFKARMIEPHERVLKRAEDWKKGAESLKKIQEESYATGASEAGQFKLNVGVELKGVEHRAGAKVKAKYAGRELEERLAAEKFDDLFGEEIKRRQGELVNTGMLKTDAKKKATEAVIRENPQALQTIQDEVLDEMTKSVPAADRGKEKKKLQAAMGKKGIEKRIKDGLLLHSMHEVTTKESVGTQEIEKKIRRSNEVTEAKKRDELLVNNNKQPMYAQAVLSKHQQEDEAERSALNHREIVEQAGTIAAQIRSGLRDKGMLKDLRNAIVIGSKRGAETGAATINKVLEKIGFTEKIAADDMIGQQRKILSLMAGRNITDDDVRSAGGVPALFEQLSNDTFDSKEEKNAYMKQLDTALKVSAPQGMLNMVGLIDDTEYEKGSIQFKMRDASVVEKQDEWRGDRDYWAKEIEIPKLKTLNDIINFDQNKNLTVHVVNAQGQKILDKQAVSQIATALSSLKANTRLHNGLIKDLQTFWNDDQDGFNEVLNEMKSNEAKDAMLVAAGQGARFVRGANQAGNNPSNQRNIP